MKILNKLFFFLNKDKNSNITSSKILFSFVLVCIFLLFISLVIYENNLQYDTNDSISDLEIDEIKQSVVESSKEDFSKIIFTKEEIQLIDELRKKPIKYYFNSDYGTSIENYSYDRQYFYIKLIGQLLNIEIEIIEPLSDLTALEAVDLGVVDFSTINEYENFDSSNFYCSLLYSDEKLYGVGSQKNVMQPNGKDVIFMQQYNENIHFDMINYTPDKITYFDDLSNEEKQYISNNIAQNEDFIVIGNSKDILEIAKDSGAYLKEYVSGADLKFVSKNNDFISLLNKIGSNINTENLFTLNHLLSNKDSQNLFIEVLSPQEKNIINKIDKVFYYDETATELQYGYMSYYYKYIDLLVQALTGNSNAQIQRHKLPKELNYISELIVQISIDGPTLLNDNFYKTSSFETDTPDLLSLSNGSDKNIIYSLESLTFFKVGVLSSQKDILMHYMDKKHNINNFTDIIVYDSLENMLLDLSKNEVDFLITLPGVYESLDYKAYKELNIELINSNYLLENENWVFETNNQYLSSILDKYILLAKNNIEYEQKLISNYLERSKSDNINNFTYRITIITVCIVLSLILYYLLKKYDTKSLIEQSKKFDEERGVFTENGFYDFIHNAKSNYTILTIKINNYEKLKKIYAVEEIDELDKILIYRLKMASFSMRNELFKIPNGEYYIFIKDVKKDNVGLQKSVMKAINSSFIVFEKEIILTYKINKISSEYISKHNFPIDKFVSYMNLSENDKLRKDNILVFKNSMYTKLYNLIKLEKSMSDFDINIVKPFYQPIINVKTGEIIGAEIFSKIYLNNKLYDAIQFIDLAKSVDKLRVIDEFLLNNAITSRANLLNQKIINENFQFSLNVSPSFIENITDDLLNRLCQFHKLKSLHFLAFELSKDTLQNEQLTDKFDILKRYNIKISLETPEDDLYIFNAISSNIVDIVKINKTLALLKNEHLVNIIKQILQIPDVDYVCRFIENAEEYHYLKNLGFEKLQGYYFAVPKNYDDFIKYLKL